MTTETIAPELVERMVAWFQHYARPSDTGARVNGKSSHAEALAIAEALPDPDLKEARELAKRNLASSEMSEHKCAQFAAEVDAGEHDTGARVGVALALAAIKRGRYLAAREQSNG